MVYLYDGEILWRERERERRKLLGRWKSEKKTRDITRRGTRMPDRAESRRYLF